MVLSNHIPRAGIPSATSRTWSMPGDHFAVALLSTIPHAPGLGTHGSSLTLCTCPLSLVCLCPGSLFPQALRHRQCVSTAGPNSTCLLMDLGSSAQRVDSCGPPCPAWTSCTAGLVHLGCSVCTCPRALAHVYPRGLFLAWQL